MNFLKIFTFKELQRALLGGLLLFSGASAQSKKLCLLVFEKDSHPYAKLVKKWLAERAPEKTHILIQGAIPLDFLKCAQENVDEIVVVAHAGKLAGGGARLYYSKPILGEDRRKRIEEALLRYEDLYKKATLKSQRKESLDKLEKIKDVQISGKIIYDLPLPVLPHAFEILADYLKANPRNKLKKIRIASCFPSLVRQHYELEFSELSQVASIEFAPVNILASLLRGHISGVTLNKKWLNKSLD